MVYSDEGFCGGGVLWDTNLTWWTVHPRFTRCFEWTVLTYVPTAVLWLFTSISSAAPDKHKAIRAAPIPITLFNICKNFIALVIALCYFWSAVWDAIQGPEGIPLAGILSDVLNCASCLLVVFLQYMNRRAGETSSSLVFTYWFTLGMCYLPRYYRVMLATFNDGVHDQVTSELFIVTSITYPLIVVSFFLNCFSDTKPAIGKRTNPSPVLFAPPLSSLVFDWITPFIIKGYRSYITLLDLYDPLPYLKAESSYKQWIGNWNTELLNANYNAEDGTYDKSREPSLFRSIMKTFYPTILFALSMTILRSFIRSSPALILNLVTNYMSDLNEPLWKGILYAFAIFAANTTGSFCFRHADYIMATIGVKVKGILITAVYQKALKISSRSQGKYTVGELVNLVSVDADKVLRLCTGSIASLSCPVTITITIVLLWQYLGPSCLAGVGVILVMMPISGFLALKNRRFQERQMKLKDKRLKGMNEIVNSIKILKLFAWEPPFTVRVEETRTKEVSLLQKYAYMTAGIGFFWTCTPFLVGLMSFMTFVLISEDNILTPTVAFVSLTLFNQMRFSMVVIPDFISNAIQTSVSFKRIFTFLTCEEMNPHIIGSNPENGDAVTMRNVSATWSPDSKEPVISNIDLHANKGKLLAVVGPVGSGKSTVLSAILGDLSILEGNVDVLGSVAYVPQQAWIQNKTIRQNITFTSEFNRKKYDKVIEACCLKPDLEILPGGDKTEIGEKGINLSGGQKQRVSLARAVYQSKDIYLFDDPLSAVDAHVGSAIFNNLIGPKGMINKKTRVLVTNNLSVLPDVDYIIVLKDGKIVEKGTYNELMDAQGVLSELLKDFMQKKEEPVAATHGADGIDDDIVRRMKRGMSHTSEVSVTRSRSLAGSIAGEAEGDLEKFQLIAKETVEEGSIKLQIYLNYLKHIGGLLTCITLLCYVGYRSLDIGNGMWLANWSEDDDPSAANRDYRLGIYAVLGLSQGVCNFFGVAFLTKATITASSNLHTLMLHSIMRAPLSFFDTTPMGRLLNRFGKDLDQLDVQLPMMANFTLEMFFQIIGMVILISINLPIFIAMAVPSLGLFILLRQIFVMTLRQVKRLEAVTRSPLYSHFSETISGLTSIRGYGVSEMFKKENEEKVDLTQNCSFHITICNYWMSIRLEFLGNLMIFIMVVLVVVNRGVLDAGTAGLLISYSLNSVVAFNFFVYFSTEVEATIIAAERLDEYTNIAPEADWKSKSPPAVDWPKNGKVEFMNYDTRYRPGLELILKDVDLSISPLQKVGVVGRTGAGKSSLILTIFRIIEAVKGKILIDDMDIAKIGLHELRSRLTIIPQESVLFNGSLRFNLDPNGEYGDDLLWIALERAHLKKYFEQQQGLDTNIAEGGNNLSVGQRQLVCLGRAVLRKTRILVLDEATAAVDLETDALIQETIRQVFSDSTIITIAHRLNTILDSDVVVVMAAGEIIEMGNPQDLLQNPQSEFYSLAKEAGIALNALPVPEEPIILEEESPSIIGSTEIRDSSKV